jgi:hypothetical protein
MRPWRRLLLARIANRYYASASSTSGRSGSRGADATMIVASVPFRREAEASLFLAGPFILVQLRTNHSNTSKEVVLRLSMLNVG